MEQTTLRVWDVLFNEGVKVLFRVAIALFKVRIKRERKKERGSGKERKKALPAAVRDPPPGDASGRCRCLPG